MRWGESIVHSHSRNSDERAVVPPGQGSAAVAERLSRGPSQRNLPAQRTVAVGDPTAAQVGRSVAEARLLAAQAVAPSRSLGYDIAKRFMDILVGSIALVLAFPLMLLLGAIIRLDSPGSPVFRQSRIGLRGREFTFYKFRTMYADARQRFPDLYDYNYQAEDIPTLYFKLAYDQRCTRVGKRLRRTSLDELPNLINVVLGDMSLVGPRPEIPQMLPFYGPEQYCKFAVKPGLTGLAQTGGRNILRFVDTNAKDVEYVHRRSPALDLKILLATVWVVVLMLGAH